MRSNWRTALLAAGITSLSASGVLAASGDSRLQSFVARLESADAAERKRILSGLTKADRKALHQEYRALSPDAKKAVRPALKAQRTPARSPRGGVGTIQYDTGVVHGFRDNSDKVVGNRFNSGFGNPHSISMVTFQNVGIFLGACIVIHGTPVGTAASVLASTCTSPFPPGSPVEIPIGPVTNHSGTFLIGEQQAGTSDTINTTFTAIAVDVNNGGDGFHGMTINFGGSGFNPNPTVFPGQPYNAFMRATGNNLPVELMNFNVQ